MIKPRLSPVAPRVKVEGGEAVLLTDHVELLLRSEFPVRVRIDGEFSQDALAHVAQKLRPDVESGRLRIQGMPAANVVPIVRLCGTHEQLPQADSVSGLEDQFDLTYRLLPWWRDEFIEYLLSRHPQQCRSVMERLQPADLFFAHGSPLVWQVILSRMAGDSSQTDLDEIVVTEVRARIDDASKYDAIADELISQGVFTRPARVSSLSSHHPAARLLRNVAVKHAVAMQRFLHRLSIDNGRDLIDLVSYDLSNRFAQIGSQLAGDKKTCGKLAELFLGIAESAHRDSPVAANCATLLAQADSEWRPQGESLALRGATFTEVKWPEIDLSKFDLRRVDFSGSDLSFVGLRDSRFSRAKFSDCNMRGADLSISEDTTADSEEETQGGEKRKQGGGKRQTANERAKKRRQRSRVKKYKKILAAMPNTILAANFDGSDLTDANLSGRAFVDCSFRNAILQGVNGRRLLNLVSTDLYGADLTGAQFADAIFQAANFASVNIDECNFDRANLVDSKLVNVRARGVNFSHAQLRGAEWTGSHLKSCHFLAADLTMGRVAEIQWEDCDLRDADLRGLDFHMGSSRSGMVDSPYPSHGTRTGFYTDDYADQHFRRPEEIRKASLVGCDLRGADIAGVDFYLVDLRGAKFDEEQRKQFISCGAILDDNQ